MTIDGLRIFLQGFFTYIIYIYEFILSINDGALLLQ